MKKKLVDNLIMLTVFGGMLIGLFTPLHLVYAYTNYGSFYVYVPENATFTECNCAGWFNKPVGYVDVITKNNTTLKFECVDADKLLDYRGKYVVVTLKYGNSDDESGYARYIKRITEQEGNVTLGYYPEGTYYRGYFYPQKFTFIDFAGLLGLIPFIVFIIKVRRS